MEYRGSIFPATRGMRLNNPLNIERTSDNWVGAEPSSNQTDKRFVRFTEMGYGIRAAIKILLRYRVLGYNTAATVINRWAPAPENKPDQYLKFVCEQSGIQPYKLLAPEDYYGLIAAMAAYESMMYFKASEIKDVAIRFKLTF